MRCPHVRLGYAIRAVAVGRLLPLALAILALAPVAGARDADREVKVIRIGAGPTGATDFPFGGLIANAISNPPGSRECDRGGNCGVPGLIAVAQTTTNAADNLRAVARGDLEMALSQGDAAAWAYLGAGAFLGQQPLSDLRVLARLYPANVHLVVRKDSPIKSVTDLKGKRIAVGTKVSANAATAKLILSAYGVKWNTVRFSYLDFPGITDALATGAVDALFMVSGAPVLALEDLAGRTPIKLVPISGPTGEKLAKIFPFYSRGLIPPNTYGDNPAVETLDVGSVLVARSTMNPELAYGIVRAIWHDRNAALFRAGHPRGRLMDKTFAARNFGVPIASGADRYYLENGLMDPPSVEPPTSPVAPSPEPPVKAQSTTARTPS